MSPVQTMASGGTDPAILAAVISSAAALLVSIGAQIVAAVRVRTDRAYARRRQSLLDVQTAMLDLRRALRRYGDELRSSARAARALRPRGDVALDVPDEVDAAVSAARGELGVAVSRVEDQPIVDAVHGWQAAAEESSIDVADTTAGVEQAAFDRVNDLVGHALRTAECRVPQSMITR
jgi:hypothetical protein